MGVGEGVRECPGVGVGEGVHFVLACGGEGVSGEG